MIPNLHYHNLKARINSFFGGGFPARVNGCTVVERKRIKLDGTYGTHVIINDSQNYLAISFLWRECVRIEECVTTDYNSFSKLMSTAYILAVINEYDRIFFAGHIDEEVLRNFLEFGFVEEATFSGDRNRYLEFCGISHKRKKGGVR